jgi:hypothetical protein
VTLPVITLLGFLDDDSSVEDLEDVQDSITEDEDKEEATLDKAIEWLVADLRDNNIDD